MIYDRPNYSFIGAGTLLAAENPSLYIAQRVATSLVHTAVDGGDLLPLGDWTKTVKCSLLPQQSPRHTPCL